MKKESKIQYKPNPFLRIIRILLIVSFAVYVATGFLMHVDMRNEEEKEKEKEYRNSIINDECFPDALNIVKTYLNNDDDGDGIAYIEHYKYRRSPRSIARLKTNSQNTYYYRCTDGLVIPIDSSEYYESKNTYHMSADIARQKHLNSSAGSILPFISPIIIDYWSGDALNIVIEEATEDKN